MFLSCCSAGPAAAQRFGVKTNALHWATAGTLNAGLEAGLGKRTSLELTGDYNPWTLDRDENRKLKFWSVMPEFRYWLCERFNGHFFGLATNTMITTMPKHMIAVLKFSIAISMIVTNGSRSIFARPFSVFRLLGFLVQISAVYTISASFANSDGWNPNAPI